MLNDGSRPEKILARKMYNVLLIGAEEGFFYGGPLTHQAIHLRTSFKEVKVPKVGGGFASLQIIQGLANS